MMTVYQKTVPPPIFALLMELTSLDVSAGKSGAAPAGPTGSLANLDDDEDEEPAAIESSQTVTGESEDSSPSREGNSTESGGEWEDVEEHRA